MPQVTQQYKNARAIETTLDSNVAKLTEQEAQLTQSLERLQDKYDYQGRLQTVGEQLTISTILKDYIYINNPAGYFEFLKSNGISEVYVDIKEALDSKGAVDYEKLQYLGRVIQSAQQNGMKIKLILRAGDDWAEGGVPVVWVAKTSGN